MNAYDQFKKAIDLEEGEIEAAFEAIIKKHRLESNGRSNKPLVDLLTEFFNCVIIPSRAKYDDFIELYCTSDPADDDVRERNYEWSFLQMTVDMERQILGTIGSEI